MVQDAYARRLCRAAAETAVTASDRRPYGKLVKKNDPDDNELVFYQIPFCSRRWTSFALCVYYR